MATCKQCGRERPHHNMDCSDETACVDGLRVQLASAIRERDEARAEVEAQRAMWMDGGALSEARAKNAVLEEQIAVAVSVLSLWGDAEVGIDKAEVPLFHCVAKVTLALQRAESRIFELDGLKENDPRRAVLEEAVRTLRAAAQHVVDVDDGDGTLALRGDGVRELAQALTEKKT